MAKPKPHQIPSYIRQTLNKKTLKENLINEDAFKISFKHLDRSQGQSMHHWEENHMLGNAMGDSPT